MTAKLALLDEALRMGEMELDYLQNGDLDQAEVYADRRGQLIRDMLEQEYDGAVGLLMDKLVRLRNLQGRLTGEAKRIHAQLKADLTRTKQETKRLAGYHGAVRRPNTDRPVYLSKRG